MKVYVLSEQGDDWHEIGIYSTRRKAESEMARGVWDPPSTITEWDLDAPAEHLKHIACGEKSCTRCSPLDRPKKISARK